jgi:hypothetical protein
VVSRSLLLLLQIRTQPHLGCCLAAATAAASAIFLHLCTNSALTPVTSALITAPCLHFFLRECSNADNRNTCKENPSRKQLLPALTDIEGQGSAHMHLTGVHVLLAARRVNGLPCRTLGALYVNK